MSLFGSPPAYTPAPAMGMFQQGGAPMQGMQGMAMVQAQAPYVQLPPVPSTNPFPYGRHSLFAPADAPSVAAPAAAAAPPPSLGFGAAPAAAAPPPSSFAPPQPSLPSFAGYGYAGYSYYSSMAAFPRSVVGVRGSNGGSASPHEPRHALGGGLGGGGDVALVPPSAPAQSTACTTLRPSSAGFGNGGSTPGGGGVNGSRVGSMLSPYNPLVAFRSATACSHHRRRNTTHGDGKKLSASGDVTAEMERTAAGKKTNRPRPA